MAEVRQIKAIRGTRDILPPDSALFQFVEEQAREVFRLYNFQEIRTPIFEDTALFSRSVGEETDIVGKEMFTWEDKARAQSEKPQSLTLRPENTAGVVRAYIEHKLGDKGLLQKLYYIGPQFRRERPQKGRYRQFYQIGAETIGPVSAGSESPACDAELIVMLEQFMEMAGITQHEVHINSVGCKNCRPVYNKVLQDRLAAVVGMMCQDCQRRAITNPIRVLDCKVPADQPIIEGLPRISEYLDAPCREHMDKVIQILHGIGVPSQVNERMVRGLDYYTRTTFEFLHGALGAQSSLLGGGRYDGLSEMLGGPRAPGVGFAMGLDRFILALQAEHSVPRVPERRPRAYLAPLGQGMDKEAAKLAFELRAQGIAVEVGDESFRLKKAFETAERLGIRYVVIIGENEVKSGDFAVKNIESGEQVDVARTALCQKLKS